MKYLLLRLKRFCGFGVGIVFFISGILKLIDPVGASLVVKEYYQFLHMDFLNATAMVFALIFAFSEAVIGAGLVTGVWRRIIAPVAVGMQGFFTLLTLALVIFNPEMDCGCFGEAIHLTHGQTFIKNLILLALLLIYYIPAKHLGETRKKKYVSFAIVCISAAAFGIYSLLYIPMQDFTYLSAGTEINKAENTYQATFVYEKDGKQENFTLENLPDSTWTYVTTDSAPGGQGADSPVISIYSENGDYADSLLTDGNVMIVSLYKDNQDAEDMAEIMTFMEQAGDNGFTPLLLTSFPLENAPSYHYMCDYKTLITLNRSNSGATYLNNGYIIRKWAKRTLPAPEELAMISDEDSTETFIGRDTKTSLAFQGFLLYVFAVMLLL